MLKPQNLAIVGALLVGAIVLFWGLVWLTPSFKSCVSHEQAAYHEKYDGNGPQAIANVPAFFGYWGCAGETTHSNGEAITAISTALLALITLGLGLLGLEQSQTTRAELRAYVSAVPVFIYSFDATHPPAIKLKIHNHGKTPAKKMRHRAEIEILRQPLRPGLSLPSPSSQFSNPAVLFPSGDLDGHKKRANCFTANEISDIKNESARIYVYGEVEYFDGFSRTKRKTTFCSALVADGPTLKKLAANYKPIDLVVSFEVAPMGNDAT